ncbi:hypothetical protein [Urechidicola croceus]|uniref:PAP2 family protein n=1 Tax=Urechidicola croceus TaxID=1850246 RepID=A0A1D8PA62_9FLAO|nr:hypothetical protein [Urechidicola croceus]AOW21455.1 hypothetical protein LPB138_12540 [Urechidicola croceus]
MKFNKFISFIIHPIIFPIVGTLLYFILLPRHVDKQVERLIILTVFVGTYILPLLFMSILKKMNIIDSFQLFTIKERKYPLLFFVALSYILGIMFFRALVVKELSLFFFGMTLAIFSAYLLLYINFKTSLHTLAIGGLIGFIGILSYTYQLNLILILVTFFILAGIIGTSRLKLNAHLGKEIYIGFLIGLSTQIIAFLIYNR